MPPLPPAPASGTPEAGAPTPAPIRGTQPPPAPPGNPVRTAAPPLSPSAVRQGPIRWQWGRQPVRQAGGASVGDLSWLLLSTVLVFLALVVTFVIVFALYTLLILSAGLSGHGRLLPPLTAGFCLFVVVLLVLLTVVISQTMSSAGSLIGRWQGQWQSRRSRSPAPSSAGAGAGTPSVQVQTQAGGKGAKGGAQAKGGAAPQANGGGSGAVDNTDQGQGGSGASSSALPDDTTARPAPAPAPAAPAESPAPAPIMPGGTIVGYGQRVAPAGWTVKDKIQDGFPSVPDFAPPLALAERGWAIVGSSRIGRGHQQDGKYREDAIAAEIVDGVWHLAAVADGGGSYKLARLGAQVAAHSAVEAMRQALGDVRAEPGSAEEKARRVVEQGLRVAHRALNAEAQRLQQEQIDKQSGIKVEVRDLRTTLLLLLHRQVSERSHLVAGGQVGDGAVVARALEGSTAPSDPPTLKMVWLSAPDTGPQGNETTFLPDVPDTDAEWQQRVRAQVIASPLVYCLAMTDGIADDFTPLEDDLWRLEKPMFQVALAEKAPVQAAQRKLEEFLGYERQGSFDDRSLVCIYPQGARPWK